ncbi:MAG: leucine-rich repeat protein, partial [Oscillospiraceae bacterium]|nr:leucine-rich repeat protein [Oscillospiraceae bacterium]
SIGESAFEDCSSLTSVNIPDSVTSIGYAAFRGTAWYDLQPDGLVYAGKVAYSYKGKMPENTSIILKEGTKGIAAFAFYGRTSLTSVNIPDSVTSIGDWAFYLCTSLTSVNIPDSVMSIGERAFSGCLSLTSVNIPDGVTSIGEAAFSGCRSFTALNIPNSVTSIGWDAFSGCSLLTSVNIPDSVTCIGLGAFSYCSSLTAISVSSGNSVYHSEGNCLIHTKSKALISGCKNSLIPSDGSVTRIGYFAFSGCTDLASVYIPESVKSIDWGVFFDCINLTDVYCSGSEDEIEIDHYSLDGDCYENITIHYNHTHTWNKGTVTKAATCAAVGVKTYTCTACGATKTESLAKINDHKWDDGVVTKEPTKTSKGVKTYTCTVCEKIKLETIPKLTGSVIDTNTVKEKDDSVYTVPNLTAVDVIMAAGTGAKILKADGKELGNKEKVGSGMTLVKSDGTKITIIVKGDNDGNGEITASDARLALRTAVGLEKPNNWQKNASLVDSSKADITAADARLILRAAVKLETLNLY